MRCAVAAQREMAQRNAEVPEALRIEFRMGINLGDIIKDGHKDGHDIYSRALGLTIPPSILARADEVIE